MNLSSRLNELKKKHRVLSEKVEEAQRALSGDDFALTDLKKQKLRLKEEIAKLSQAA